MLNKTKMSTLPFFFIILSIASIPNNLSVNEKKHHAFTLADVFHMIGLANMTWVKAEKQHTMGQLWHCYNSHTCVFFMM